MQYNPIKSGRLKYTLTNHKNNWSLKKTKVSLQIIAFFHVSEYIGHFKTIKKIAQKIMDNYGFGKKKKTIPAFHFKASLKHTF